MDTLKIVWFGLGVVVLGFRGLGSSIFKMAFFFELSQNQ